MVTCDYTTDWDPGPWTTEEQWHGTGIKSGQRTVARVNQRADARIEAANARLIAAAPDMLEALEAVMYFWGRDPLAFGDEATINSLAGRFAAVADQCRVTRNAARGLEDL